MGNLKVLQLETWMKVSKVSEKTLESYIQCLPVFNRPGQYFLDGVAWFELPDGRAFLEDPRVFQATLRLYDRIALSQQEINCLRKLRALSDGRLLSRRQRNNLEILTLGKLYESVNSMRRKFVRKFNPKKGDNMSSLAGELRKEEMATTNSKHIENE